MHDARRHLAAARVKQGQAVRAKSTANQNLRYFYWFLLD